jgi:hypothetical protein
MQYLPFRSLLYRYFFYGWLFCDASRGNRFEQAAAMRHNRAQAHWLPTYMRRWLVLGALFFCAAAFCETALNSPQVSAWFYVPSVLSMPINFVTAVCWLGLALKWGDSVPGVASQTAPNKSDPAQKPSASGPEKRRREGLSQRWRRDSLSRSAFTLDSPPCAIRCLASR